MSKINVDGGAPRFPVEQPRPAAEVETPKPVETTSPHPHVGAMGRVAIAVPTNTPAPGSEPGILAYVAELTGEDFLRFSPPEVKAFTIDAIKNARLGEWRKMRALGALLSTKEVFSKQSWKEALGEAFEKLNYEMPRLTRDEIALVRSLVSGPIAEVVREREGEPRNIPAPRDLKEFRELLEDSEIRAKLIALYREKYPQAPKADADADVDAALSVTRAILEQMDDHVDATMLDRPAYEALLGDDGRLDPKKLDALPPYLRILLEDPRTGPQAVAALKSGVSISAHVIKKTPDHVIGGLTRFSATLAGGGFLWVDELARTGRKLQITAGDVERMRATIERMTGECENVVTSRKEKIAATKKIDEPTKTRFAEALAIKEPAQKIAALQSIAAGATGAAKIEADKLIQLFEKIESFRATDPKTSLESMEQHIRRFEDFRKDAVRIRVHGKGSSAEHGLKGAIAASPRLQEYAHRTVIEAVSHDYAREASESARQIIYGVAGLAVVGVGMHELLGDGAMHTLISIAEDVATDIGEIASLTSQGIPIGDILKGSRFLGQLFTFGLATLAASQAHHLIRAGAQGSAGMGALGGLVLGIGASALSAYTSIYSFYLFRNIAREHGREGKHDFEDYSSLRKELAGKADAATKKEVIEALDAARAEHKRLPTGAELIAQINKRGKINLAARTLGADYDALLAKHSHRELLDGCREGLQAVAQRAGIDPALLGELEAAFDAARAKLQGIPTGENLVRELAARKSTIPAETYETIAAAQDDLVKLATSGVDFGEVLAEMGRSLAEKLGAAIAERGFTVDQRALEQRLRARLRALDEKKNIDPQAILGTIRGAIDDAIELASKHDPAAAALKTELEPTAKLLEAEATHLTKLIDEQLAPEMAAFANRSGRAQTLANPVRKMLMLGAIACLSSLTVVGGLLPSFLLGKLGAGVLAFLASTESIFATVALSVQHRAHGKTMKAIGEEFAREARTAKERAAPSGHTVPDQRLSAGTKVSP